MVARPSAPSPCPTAATASGATTCAVSSTAGWPTASSSPACDEAVGEVIDHPEWLRLEGRIVVVLGAAAEMGPLRSLLRWGGTVAAVDLPRPDLWNRLLDDTRGLAGRVLVPATPGSSDLAQRAGVDLIHDLPTATGWVCGLPGSLVVGNYVYADGATNVRVSTAVDALTDDGPPGPPRHRDVLARHPHRRVRRAG